MENQKVAENAKVVQDKNGEPPSREVVREWVKRDLHAAHYALRLLLRYPDIVERMADEMYERLIIEEQDLKQDQEGLPNG